MTTSKLLDNNRRSHAAKVLAQASKKHQEHANTNNEEQHQEGFSADTSAVENNDVFSSLNEQYGVIREDIFKLREDLAHGYDLIKDFIASNLSVKTFLRSK